MSLYKTFVKRGRLISGDRPKPHIFLCLSEMQVPEPEKSSQALNTGLNVLLSSYSVLRDNPLACSCDLHWLQQWHLSSRGDVDSQMMTCFSGNTEVSLGSLQLENCSEFELGLHGT